MRAAVGPIRSAVSFPMEKAMQRLRFTKGDLIADAFVNPLDDGCFRGLVSISDASGDARVYRAEPTQPDEGDALAQASALAQHLLKRLEN